VKYSTEKLHQELGIYIVMSSFTVHKYIIKQMLLGGSSSGDSKVFRFDQQVSHQKLAKLLISAKLPFKIVEHPAFIKFVKSLQVALVRRQKIRNDCIALFVEERKKLHAMFKYLKACVSYLLICGHLINHLGYVAITAHYINDDFVLKKKILAFKRVSNPHTSFAINDVFTKKLVE